MTKEDEKLVSPISMVFTESYPGFEKLKNVIDNQIDKIQCLVGNSQIQSTLTMMVIEEQENL